VNKVLFIDRDGTLIEEPADQQVDSLHKIRLMPGVIPALIALRDAGFRFVMVSNQDGLGSASFRQQDFSICQEHVLSLFNSQGIYFDAVLICPHTADDGCDCRKPRPGLLTRYLASTNLDLRSSAVVGDRDTDLELAKRIGVQGFRLNANADWEEIRRALTGKNRRGVVERRTSETALRVTVDLDTEGGMRIASGIGFYDHMLEQLAKHGGFSLELDCNGDLQVDEHHTVEDTAICIGKAIRQALGDKRGIGRFGFLLPMDESEARVTLDLSGRASFRFTGDFPREQVGGLPTELVPHFFASLCDSLGATLHLEVNGENTHHMVEACFKCVGRALRQATRHEGGALPSTKGTLN